METTARELKEHLLKKGKYYNDQPVPSSWEEWIDNPDSREKFAEIVSGSGVICKIYSTPKPSWFERMFMDDLLLPRGGWRVALGSEAITHII